MNQLYQCHKYIVLSSTIPQLLAMSSVQDYLPLLGTDEVQLKSPLWRSLVAEFIGTAFLVLVGCGSTTAGWNKGYSPSMEQISLCFGLIVATMVQAICHMSGGHINPAVTFGLMVSRRCPMIRSFFYIIVQCLGATVGAGLLKLVTPKVLNAGLGVTSVDSRMTVGQAVALEMLITFVLVFTVMAVTDSSRLDVKGSAPLAIGFSITACHLWALQLVVDLR
ncbi:aquaporin AQPAe.a-like [Uloborus diversus]|uniref:aquaporin AQPAe.a-like n=1 Tax=Uloborus diversus TaxID=327109 RepID=UPI0024090BBF|nr:aquaporin AQPAe.a-like [Uloborus diversus]